MTAEDVIGLFADETRVRVFAAVALGATSATEVAERTGLPTRDVLLALHRLEDREVVTAGTDGLEVSYAAFRRTARDAAGPRSAQDHGTGDERTETVLRTFLRDGRLVKLPAQWSRKQLVLHHVAERTFEPGGAYSEKEVNDRLRAWCEGGGLDHVTLRRYLVDLHHLHRHDGVYHRPADATAR
ncbi:hypothetical protein SUDANB176_03885 [Streptomyces sp. enrichment culture]|uniref:DUF2087 domain-containing protein n=1 Tax=Streptomyces sp. enrichment culture TaxID=1795815 RepID=UPI003F54C0DC